MPTIAHDYAPAPTLSELNARLARDLSGWPSFDACPVCGGSSGRFAVLRHMPYDRCRDCGFTFANPYPPPRVCDGFYSSAFYGNYRTLEDRRRGRDRYFSASMYTDPRELASLIAAYSPETLLDYGCGTGAFLLRLREEFGIRGDGLEIGAQARDAARRYGLRLAATARELPQSSYDMVLLLEVIEHVPDPVAFLEGIAGLIAPGGRLVITTPAVDNPVARWLPGICDHYTAPSHVSLFTVRSIDRLLRRFALIPERRVTDPARHTVRRAAISALYGLDFVSPRHDDDTDDSLFIPTRLGRRRGRVPTRKPLLGSRTESVTRLADRTLARLAPRPDHLYLVARSAPAVASER